MSPRLRPLSLLGLLLACREPQEVGPTAPPLPVIAEPEGELEGELEATGETAAGPAVAGDAAPLRLLEASGSDGHAPALATDGRLSTRWSQYGRGAWLQADVGSLRTLEAVQVAWHRGERRYNRFTLSVSEDGARFRPVFTGLSSGHSAAPERYAFRPVPGRYVRVTVEGNSENDWASISELAVHAGPPQHAADTPPRHAHESGGERQARQVEARSRQAR